MKGPNLKDTTPYTAVKGLNLGGPSKILLGLQQVGRRSLLCVFFVSRSLGTNRVSILDSRGRMEFNSTLSILGGAGHE